MKNFFKSRVFKVLTTAIAVLLAVTVVFGVIGHKIAPQSNVAGAVFAPIQKFVSWFSSSVEDFFTAVSRSERLEEENNRLREELGETRKQLVDFDKYKSENEFLRQFLDLKEDHPDFMFAPATVISSDGASVKDTMVIDAGSSDGIELHDPVITPDGLVGYVSEVGISFSTVTTVLSPALNVGAMDSRTRETGVVSGDTTLSESGLCKLGYLSRSSLVAIDDYVITSGSGGVFPQGLIIGTVSQITKDEAAVTLSASVKPAVDFGDISNVMVITQFEGQGGLK